MIEQAEKKRLGVALTASLVAHVLLGVLITFAYHDKALPKKDAPQIMDVVLLDPKKESSKKQPKDARTVSNRNAEGSSSKAQDRMTRAAKAPPPGQPSQNPSPMAPQPAIPPSPEQNQGQRMRALSRSDLRMDDAIASLKPEKSKQKTPPKPTPNIPITNLMPSTMALAQLSRDFEREKRLQQYLNKEADIPINTREAKYAPYAQSLVRVLEEQWRPDSIDYSKYDDKARQVLIKITIDSNGELHRMEILRPSPLPSLNESATEAIHAAAPFRPLPSSWGLDRASFYLTFEVVEDRFVFRTL